MNKKEPLYIKWENLTRKICHGMKTSQIEYEDLHQVAIIALLGIEDGQIKTNEFSFVKTTIVNACVNYIELWESDPLSFAIPFDEEIQDKD